MKKSELKQLIRETVEEVRIISEANKIAEYLESNPRLVKSLMAHGVLTEADMSRRDFLKRMGMGLAGAGLTAAGLKGAESGGAAAIDPMKLTKNWGFLAEVDELLTKHGVRKEWEKTGWNIFEIPHLAPALETVLRTHEDLGGGYAFNGFSRALDNQIKAHDSGKEKSHHNENDKIFVVLTGFKKIEKPLYALLTKYMKNPN